MMAALEKGGIDAAVLTEPTFFFAEDQGYRVLADLADTDIYYLHSMIDTTRAFVRTHRDLVLRFMQGYLEGIAYFKKNRKESIEVLAKKLRTAPVTDQVFGAVVHPLQFWLFRKCALSVVERGHHCARFPWQGQSARSHG